MAGNLMVNEILRLGSRAKEAASPLPGQRPIHQYGSCVSILAVPKNVAGMQSPLGTPAAVELNETEALGQLAFEIRQSPKFAHAKNRRARKNERWDFGVNDVSPNIAPQSPLVSSAEEQPLTMPTSQRMTGRIAIGIVIVNGPDTDLKFSDTEKLHVVAEVQEGLSWLASLSAEAKVTWIYDLQDVNVQVLDNYPLGSYEEMEAPWRDPALQTMGFTSGFTGIREYIEDLRTKLRTDWTFSAFFTKYRTRHFAYATIGGPRLVMQYDNDAWGPNNIDRVFAHETCHVFGAPDEYFGSGCDCGGSWGYYRVPNGNCEPCASGGGVDCIMRSNEWAVCPFTRAHLGFPGVGPSTVVS